MPPERVRGFDVVAQFESGEPEFGLTYDAWRVVAGQRKERVVLRVFADDSAEVTDSLDRADRLLTAYDRGLPKVVEVARTSARAVASAWLDPANTLDRQGPLPALRALEVAAAVAETLAYLHGLDDVPDATIPGMAHGGVALETIRVTESATHLLDVPLGPVRQAVVSIADGWVPPPWLTPEHINDSVGTAADIHALGFTLVEAMSGKPPYDLFDLATPEEWLRARKKVDLGDAVRALPNELRAIGRSCLALAPGDRPTASELAAALRGVASLLPSPVHDSAATPVARVRNAMRGIAPERATGLAPPSMVAARPPAPRRRTARKVKPPPAFRPFFIDIE